MLNPLTGLLMWLSPPLFNRAVAEMSASAFEHISHSLMGRPLSLVLVATGIGLRSGALLITGAKVTFNLCDTRGWGFVLGGL